VDQGIIIRDTLTGVFAPNASDTFTFNKYYTFTVGDHNLCVFSEVPNDTVKVNDTTCAMVKGMMTYAVNYEDNFDTKTDWFGTGTQNMWIQGTPNKTHMTSAYSAPNAWVTNLTGNYASGAEEYLYSPYFTISPNASSAIIDFRLFVDVIGTYAYGNLEYSFDGINWSGYGYIGMPSSVNWYNQQINGKHVWAMQNSGWAYTSAVLDSATFNTGTPFQLRFAFTSTGNGVTAEGMAIDNFRIKIPAYAQDAGVSGIINPVGSTVTADSINVSVEVKNFGSDTLATFPVSYSINGTVIATETWTGQLLEDSVATFSFSTKYKALGNDYTICAYTSLPNDMQVYNDTTCATIVATPAARDAGITTVIAPSGQASIGKPTTVKVNIKNFGTDTLKSVPVEYLINSLSHANEVYTGLINPGDSVDYTFTTTYVSAGGVYAVCGRTNLTNDADNSNDQSCVTVVGTSIDQANGDGFMVSQNKPNPAKNNTTIEFHIPKTGKVQFKLVNMMGAVLQEHEQNYSTGDHKMTVETQSLETGVYYYSLSFDGQIKTYKMIIMR